MTIRLETSKRTGIRNVQGSDISAFHRRLYSEIHKSYSLAKARTDMSAVYNCHGLTFASRRTRIEDTQDILKILQDDRWEKIDNIKDVLPGDIVVYFSQEGEANHSGIIVGYEETLHLPIVCSKWNVGSEYVHSLAYCPEIYGPDKRFYRCRL
jgi:hypothetical protein